MKTLSFIKEFVSFKYDFCSDTGIFLRYTYLIYIKYKSWIFIDKNLKIVSFACLLWVDNNNRSR